MDTIKRLGENETVRRISNGTLKSYVDREIDTVDTSAFINLETLNVPKAESVTIGEGIKDTLEVLNAPKAEEVAVSIGKGMTVNWGKCGGSTDVVVTYKEGEGIWIPKTFFTQAPMRTSTSGVNSTIPDIGYIGKFRYMYPSDGQYYCGIVYRLPQILGKWLYDNAESGNAYGNTTSKFYINFWKGIAIYPDTASDWTNPNGWGIAIRKGSEIGIMKKDSNGTIPTGYNYDITSEPFYSYINANDYYLVAEDDTSTGNKYAISGMLDVFGDNTVYFRHWKDMDSVPSATNKGEKYTAPSSLCTTPLFNETLSNLPSLKVADVHTMDVDVPMFKGCTNLEKATVGGADKIESGMEVDWGEGQGGTVVYKEGEPIWIPKSFIDKFAVNSKLVEQPWDKKVGYQGIATVASGKIIYIYKLPYNIGKYLYNNAEDSTSENGIYGTVASDSMFYKGIAYYTDVAMSDNSRLKWCGFGIRIKEDIGKYLKGQNGGSMPSLSLEDDTYYLVAECKTSPTTTGSSITGTSVNSIEAHLTFMNKEQIYLRHWNHLSSVPSITDDNKYYMPSGYTYISHPTLDSSYFEGCDNLKEVIITNPELRIGNAVPKAMTVNWGKCGGTEDVIVEYKEGEGLWIPKAFLEQAYTDDTYSALKSTSNSTDVGYKTRLYDMVLVYKLPQEFGKWLYENAESCSTNAYNTSFNQSKLYKGIAIYPDTLASGATWDSSEGWGVGIRMKSDMDRTETNYVSSYITSAMNSVSLEDDAYYLMAEDQHLNKTKYLHLSGQLAIFDVGDDSGTDHIWFRHFNTMTSKPSATNQGKKYTPPTELCSLTTAIYADETKVPVEEQPLVVNWGKCGGTDDVIVTYSMGDPVWVPKNFLLQAYDTTRGMHRTDTITTSDVGYTGFFSYGSFGLEVYKLPQNLGKWLYENAETAMAYGSSSYNIYKGIAIYSDTVKGSWTNANAWGVGIRTKEDINVSSSNNGVLGTVIFSNPSAISALEDGVYYLVAQADNGSSMFTDTMLGGQLTERFADIDDTGTDHIWFRHFIGVSSRPSSTNKGAKYTTSAELYRPQKNVYYSKTRKKDSFTVNWGEGQGGTVTYKKGDPLWIPNAFLMSGINTDKTMKTVPVDGVGYKAFYHTAKTSETGWSVWELPQNIGKYLYDNSEGSYTSTQYGLSDSDNNRRYRCIAMYPDSIPSPVWGSYSPFWSIGIRKKSDINCWGYQNSGEMSYLTPSDSVGQSTLLKDDVYYLVAECGTEGTGTYSKLQNQLEFFNINDNGSDHLYLKRWLEIGNQYPRVDRQGSKYLVVDELCTEPLQITMAEYLKENNPNYDFRER